ncbi:MAG: hypothetical protein IJL91_07120 [Bacteroidales bacterium]|nr:hypothetical protein [Bacteroidales bacterium]
MKIIERILTGAAVVLLMIGIASIESTPVFIPILMILGGGAWIVYASNAYKWE